MKGRHASMWGGVFVALTLVLGGCVGEPVDDEEQVDQTETALTEDPTPATRAITQPGGVQAPTTHTQAVRGALVDTNMSSDPDPNPWVPPKSPDDQTK